MCILQSVSVFQYPVSKPSYNRVFVFGNALTGALGVPYLKRRENTNYVQSYRSPKRLGFAEKFEVLTNTHLAHLGVDKIMFLGDTCSVWIWLHYFRSELR